MPIVEILEQKGHHFLWIDGEWWMSDLPSDHHAMEALASRAFGDVLVAGYGLGLVQRYLKENRDVRSILTVETCFPILDECKRVFGKELIGEVVIADFFNLPKNYKFDCVVGDIWLEVALRYLPEYCAFKQKAECLLKPNGKMLAWGSECFDIWLEQERVG